MFVERRHANPLLPLRLLRHPALAQTTLSGAVVIGTWAAFAFIITLHLQQSLAWAPLLVALAFVPANIFQPIVGPLTGRLVHRFGAGWPLLAGSLAMSAGYALLMQPASDDYWTSLLPTMIAVGIGFALTFPAVNVSATLGHPESQHGVASGIVNTGFQIGVAIAIAITVGGHGPSAGRGAGLDLASAAVPVLVIAAIGIIAALARIVIDHRARRDAARADA